MFFSQNNFCNLLINFKLIIEVIKAKAEIGKTQNINISNAGEAGSVMTFNAGVSPFSEIGGGPDEFGNFWSDSDIDLDSDK